MLNSSCVQCLVGWRLIRAEEKQRTVLKVLLRNGLIKFKTEEEWAMDPIQSIISRILSPQRAEEIIQRAKKSSEQTPRERAEQEAKVFNSTIGKLTGYDCEKCKNRGYIYIVKEDEDPFGQQTFHVVACKCDCLKIRDEVHRMQNSGLQKLLKRYTFDSYKVTSEWQEFVLREACEYVRTCKGWFFFGGQPGCGKTHLCTAMVGKLIRNGNAAKYMLWQDDITKIKQVSNNAEVYETLINSYKQAEVLYIDDFFKTRRGDFVSTADVNATFKIINYRYNEELPTIITSELSLEQISLIDEALGSRIAEMAEHKIFIKPDKFKNYRFTKGSVNE